MMMDVDRKRKTKQKKRKKGKTFFLVIFQGRYGNLNMSIDELLN